MATELDYTRLRRDVGASETTLSDEDAEALFVEAGERYTDAGTVAAYTRVLALQGLLSSAAKLHSYRANESQENLSDVFKHLTQLLSIWEGKVSDAIADAVGSSGAARFGGLRRKPAKVREYPGYD